MRLESMHFYLHTSEDIVFSSEKGRLFIFSLVDGKSGAVDLMVWGIVV